MLLLEDSGALIGLFIAFVCLLAATVTDDSRWDGVGSVLIGLLLGAIAVVLATEMKSLLIGESASRADRDAIHDAITSSPRVRHLIHLRTEHLGPEELLVGAKVDFDPSLSFAELAAHHRRGRGRDPRRGACGRGSSTSNPTWCARVSPPTIPPRGLRGEALPSLAMTVDDGVREQLQSLGAFIRTQRQQAQMSLRDLAEKTNVSNPYLSQIERGLHEPSMRVLKAISDALNVSIETLLARAGLVSDNADASSGAGPIDTAAAIQVDPALTDEQRSSLLAVYHSYVDPRP